MGQPGRKKGQTYKKTNNEAFKKKQEILRKLADNEIYYDSEKEELAKKWNTTKWQINNYISEVRNQMKDMRTQNLPDVVNLDVDRYEWVWKTLRQLEKEGHNFRSLLLRAMKDKEKLLGWHNENFSLEVVNNVLNEVENGTQLNYNFGKLTQEKKDRLKELLVKCKK